MLKFFRRIRRRLLYEGSLSKYLLYAIGEILLVVIGILIALQVNNWSTERSRQKEEIKIIKELNEELNVDYNWLKRNVDVQKESCQSIDFILNHIEQDLPYHDSLDRHFGLAFDKISIWLKTAAFETLKSKGVELISNDTLRKPSLDYMILNMLS